MKKYGPKIIVIALVMALVMALSGCQLLVDSARDYIDANATEVAATATPDSTPIEEPPTETPSAEPTPTETPTEEPKKVFFPETTHGKVKFSDMVFAYPDVDALKKDIETLTADIKAGADSKESLARYDELCTRYDEMSSMYSLAYVRYSLDISDEQMKKNQEDLLNDLNDLEWRLTDVGMLLIEKPELSDKFTEEYKENLEASDSLNDESIQSLVERETKLVSDYDELNTTFKMKIDGVEYAMEDALSNNEVRYTFMAEFNKKAGKIFLDLVKIRDEIAVKMGYENFTDYRYKCFGRDFTPDEARALAADVKTYIVPLYQEMIFGHLEAYLKSFDITGYELEPTLVKMENSLNEAFPELMDAWHYMNEYGLCSYSDEETKLPGSYSTLIGGYNAPFLFTHWDGDAGNVSTVFHEFGHYSNFYFNPQEGWNLSSSLDLAEVDSQGLELMMLKYSDELYGEENSDAMRLSALLNGMYGLMAACMEDEFQQWVYEHPTAGLAELNAEYARLAGEYGFDYLYGYDGTEWCLIPHHVQQPLYYISYGTSMLGALQVWQSSITDFDAAHDTYLKISARPAYSAFRATLTEAGLKDPFASGVVIGLAEAIKTYLSDID